MKKIFSIIFVVLFSSTLRAETILYCQSDLVTGFMKSNDSWQSSNFKSDRYTIKFRDEYKILEGLEERPFDCVWAYENRSILNTVIC